MGLAGVPLAVVSSGPRSVRIAFAWTQLCQGITIRNVNINALRHPAGAFSFGGTVSRLENLGFVIDLVTETCTFDGGFVCPVITMLDDDGDVTLVGTEAEFAVVKVPPEERFVTVDLGRLRDAGFANSPTSH